MRLRRVGLAERDIRTVVQPSATVLVPQSRRMACPLYQGVWPLLVSVRPETPRIVCASFMLKRGSEPATVRSHPAMPIRTVTPTAKQCPMFHYRPDRTGRAGLKGGACRSLKGWAQARCGKARPRAAFAQ